MSEAASVRIRVGAASHVDAAKALLHACRLPLGGFSVDLESFFAATVGDAVSGVAAFS